MAESIYERARRKAMTIAKQSLADAMCGHNLSAIEWNYILTEMQSRIIAHGFVEQCSLESADGPQAEAAR